jgi:hypothetical protein
MVPNLFVNNGCDKKLYISHGSLNLLILFSAADFYGQNSRKIFFYNLKNHLEQSVTVTLLPLLTVSAGLKRTTWS